MEFITVNGSDYVQNSNTGPGLKRLHGYGLQLAQMQDTCDFVWPLGKALTFVNRETAERLMRLKITAEMGAFLKNIEA